MKGAICRTVLAAVLIGSGGLLASTDDPARENIQQRFRSSADVVTIQASVRNRRGRTIQDLTPADFEVRDNGEPRPILSLRSDRHSPISLAILVDTSGSMVIPPNVTMARRALESVLGQLRPGQDEVGLFSFDANLHQRKPFTNRPGDLTDALESFEPFGTTSLYDATAAVARQLAERSATHKAVVVLTDGIDTSSKLSASEVSGLASSISVPVYVVATVATVDYRDLLTEGGRGSEAADLRQLAEWTGGQLVFATTLTETTAAAAALVNELRQQYVLAIEAANTREWRRLEVRVRRPAAVVRARSGYYGG